MNPQSGKNISLILGLLVIPTLITGCGDSKNQIDVCKPVMKAIGKFADLQLKKIQADPLSLGDIAKDATAVSDELNALAETLPKGKQKDYLQTLAKDYALIAQPDSGLEASMALVADSQIDKIRLVCPQ